MSRYLITGGAGFIGTNYTARLLDRGDEVVVYDNLSRDGARINREWLQADYGKHPLTVIRGDVRDFDLLSRSVAGIDVIVHLAAQVAVTTSVSDPRDDFETNALGTFNVLEAARRSGRDPIVLYASTNKVYGDMADTGTLEAATRYRYRDLPYGIAETRPLDFHSPYGCSKGAGDQYVLDYRRIYGLPTVVLRQSCIYGPRQFGIEDQGWLAWFMIAALTGQPIHIYGDGKQVRDLLYVDDLLDAYDRAVSRIDVAAGQAYNIGGGPEHSLSIWAEFGPLLERLLNRPVPVAFADWRPGDQRIYISDIRKAESALDWRPSTGIERGVEWLFRWLRDHGQSARGRCAS